jgi:hypothetical protein
LTNTSELLKVAPLASVYELNPQKKYVVWIPASSLGPTEKGKPNATLESIKRAFEGQNLIIAVSNEPPRFFETSSLNF